MSSENTVLPPLIPRETLFGNPERQNPKLAPDGSRIAYLAPLDGVMNIWLHTTGRDDHRCLTRDTGRGIYTFFWAEDSRRILYMRDEDGNECWRLYSIPADGGEPRLLTPFENVQVRLVAADKHFPTELLIGLNKDDPEQHDVYRLNLDSGELKLAARNPGGGVGWLADADFTVRCVMVATPDSGFELLHRPDDDAPWTSLVKWAPEDSMNSSPVGFTRDGRTLYMIDSRNNDTSRLVGLDTATGEISVLVEDAEFDIRGRIMIHPETYEIQAVSVYRDRMDWIVLDASLAEDFKVLAALSHGDFFINTRSNDDAAWVVAYARDNGPVAHYLYRRKERSATLLFENKPDLNDYTLADMEPFTIRSRDGLTLRGYITFPPGTQRRSLPLVLMVHGGPWRRDHWMMNPRVQLMANRGYVCLQVNFRGSTGFGKDFVNASIKEWGGKMHDDLVDAVRWAVRKGYADPERLAVYGASYGGYAALVGATFTPDLFCCAVDMVGPSNLITLINSFPPWWANLQAQSKRRIGDPDTEEAFLKSRSPLFKVDNIKIPILIGQGANDPRVPQAESDMIVEAMREKGLDYEYLLFPDEGHGFVRPENRLKFQAAAEKFLARHLGGRCQE